MVNNGSPLSIILARMRDIFREMGDDLRATAIETEYLFKTDVDGEPKDRSGKQ